MTAHSFMQHFHQTANRLRLLILGVILICIYGFSHAGYSVNITASNWSETPVRSYTACYYTVGMAIGSINPGTVVTKIDTTTNTYSAYATTNSTLIISGSISTCTATPNGSSSSFYAGGVSDPGITSTGVSTGGTGGASSCDVASPELLGIDSATVATVWGWGFSAVLGMYLLGYVVGVARTVVRKA